MTTKFRLRDFIVKHSATRDAITAEFNFRIAPWGFLAWFMTGVALVGFIYDFRDASGPCGYGMAALDLTFGVILGLVAVRSVKWSKQ
jgi:hypothetical protein